VFPPEAGHWAGLTFITVVFCVLVAFFQVREARRPIGGQSQRPSGRTKLPLPTAGAIASPEQTGRQMPSGIAAA